MARFRGPWTLSYVTKCSLWVEGAVVSGCHKQGRSHLRAASATVPGGVLRDRLTFLPQKPAVGQACPFTQPQAQRSYCFKKNFLALSLKLNCPLRVSYFVCSRLSCGGTTLPSLLLESRLRKAKWTRRSISVCVLPSASQGSRTHVPSRSRSAPAS